jgi:hypothetical protein
MNSTMDANERLNLKKMIAECETIDNTDYIRKVKHSIPLAKDIQAMEKLKIQNTKLRVSDPEKFSELCQVECGFLFNNYTDIYNKLLKDEIDLYIMQQILQVLNIIEEGKVDQHEGSVIVGKLLKELYLDSAIRRGENLDKENPPVPKVEGKQITWSKFAQLRNIPK